MAAGHTCRNRGRSSSREVEVVVVAVVLAAGGGGGGPGHTCTNRGTIRAPSLFLPNSPLPALYLNSTMPRCIA